jgi:hypothetical protein
MDKNRLLPFIISSVLFLTSSICAFSQEVEPKGSESDSITWVIIEGSYATIYVDNSIDLRDVVRKIDVSFARYDPIEKELFLDKGVSDAEILANEIDIITRKARKVLDMYPAQFHVDIKIYRSQEELRDVYEKIFEEKEDYIAFYIHKFKTIYISLDSISESVLAHEIGHSIVDSYFSVLPPPKIRELLACYADVHLKD